MTLTPEQLQQIKAKFDEQFDPEEKKQVLEALAGKPETPTAEPDESSRFLLSMVTGQDEQKKADEAAVDQLVKLSQGR